MTPSPEQVAAAREIVVLWGRDLRQRGKPVSASDLVLLKNLIADLLAERAAAGRAAAFAEAAKIADNWPPECLVDPEHENCGPGIAAALRAAGAEPTKETSRG